MEEFNSILITTLISFSFSLISLVILIPILTDFKFGQTIRELGPESHQSKSGTPTMGGIAIIIGFTFSVLLAVVLFGPSKFNFTFWLPIIAFLGYGLIGFLDDFIIIKNKCNKGLSVTQKLIGQIILAGIIYYILVSNEFSTVIHFPGTELNFDMGWLYAILVLFMLVGTSNATNLTDGLDGLLTGLAIISFSSLAFIFYKGSFDTHISIILFSIIGSLFAFLLFNKKPAKIFMGDTGSLAIGGLLATLAIVMKLEIMLIFLGFVYVIETLSVIIQVISFKLTRKRILKMAPIHHHFELSGWSEWKVVSFFWLVGIIVSVVSISIVINF